MDNLTAKESLQLVRIFKFSIVKIDMVAFDWK